MWLYGGWRVGGGGVIFIFFGVCSVHYLVEGSGLTILPRDINHRSDVVIYSFCHVCCLFFSFACCCFPYADKRGLIPGRIRARSFCGKTHLFTYLYIFKEKSECT